MDFTRVLRKEEIPLARQHRTRSILGRGLKIPTTNSCYFGSKLCGVVYHRILWRPQTARSLEALTTYPETNFSRRRSLDEVDLYSPPTVRPSIRIVGAATDPRNSRSLAISDMLKKSSFKLPATVISSTGNVSSPPEIQSPDAPRE